MKNFYNDDGLKVMSDLIQKNIKVDCIITDPPYKLTKRGTSGSMGGEFWKSDRVNSGKLFETPNIKDWLPLCFDILKESTHIYIMCNDKNLLDYLKAIDESRFKFIKTLTWVKPNKITGQWYMTQKEIIIMARKGKAKKINNCGTSDVITSPNFKKIKIDKDGKKVNAHDTEKPVSLMETLIMNSTIEGQIVLDPFMGSGSTIIGAIINDRIPLGIELDKKYFDISMERIENEKRNKSN